MPRVVLVLADGHGSPHCFRSDIGARFAVEVTTELLSSFFDESSSLPPDHVERAVRARLIGSIIQAWSARVDRHAADHPMIDEQLRPLASKRAAGTEDAGEASETTRLAYGTTILAVATSVGGTLCLQLGDGEILLVDDEGAVTPALAADPQLMANETTSLCMSDADRYFRIRFLHSDQASPRLVVATTDGYPNSFADEVDFRKVGADLRRTILTDGIGSVGEALEGWLRQASDEGSGDDVTVGLIWRELSPTEGAARG